MLSKRVNNSSLKAENKILFKKKNYWGSQKPPKYPPWAAGATKMRGERQRTWWGDRREQEAEWLIPVERVGAGEVT